MAGSTEDTLVGAPDSDQPTLDGDPGLRSPRRHGPTALSRGDIIGRYVVLATLGAGGMGVVYAAYDPELDRKVALKLLRSSSADGSEASVGRSRLLREAQALAKFSHPEIVAIHDVGEHQSGVWLAMEFVDGRTLGAWADAGPRPWRELLTVMLAAGRGVTAAHAASLIHRDLKPDNIMVGYDGRVRVMDFGLTRPEGDAPLVGPSDAAVRPNEELLHTPLTQHGSLLGTPAYMAPEQFAGTEVTAAADQFAFCVTLWELLFGERPFAGKSMMELAAAVLSGEIRPPKRRGVPSWLRRTLERGLAVEPSQRWPSMEVLLSELSRGQQRMRMRAALASLGVVVSIGAGFVGHHQYDRSQRVAACEAEGASIDEVWNDQARARVRAGLLATELGYASTTADKAIPWLDAHAQAWQQQRALACRHGEVDESFDAATLERSRWCLDERRMEFEALIEQLGAADEGVVQNAVTAAAGLPRASLCLDRTLLDRRPAPPTTANETERTSITEVRAELARASGFKASGKYEDGLAAARSAREQAETLAWSPLVAAALQLEGVLLDRLGRYAEAELASTRAYFEGAKAGAWEIAADAATRLVLTVGDEQARHAEGLSWAAHAELAASFAGDPLGLREASRLGNVAGIHCDTGEFGQAQAEYERALAILELALGAVHPELASVLGDLGIVHFAIGDYPQAQALFERALALEQQTLGPDHPNVSASLSNLAAVRSRVGDHAGAKALLERAVASAEAGLGREHPDVATVLNNLATVHYQTGEYEQAKPLHERALRIRERALGPEHPDVAMSLHNLANTHTSMGEYEQAKPLHERALANHEARLGPDHPSVAASLDSFAGVHSLLGEYAEAKPMFERALAIREAALGPDHPDVATSLSNLGLLLVFTDQYAEAERLQLRALAIREQALGPDSGDVSLSLSRLAKAQLALGRAPEALDLLERARAIDDAIDGVHHREHETRFLLAKALRATDGDLERAIAEAKLAREGYAKQGSARAKQLAEIDAWLAEVER